MGQINPLLGSVLATPAAQKQQAADKARQLRLARQLQSNAAAARQDITDTVDFHDPIENPQDPDIAEQHREQNEPEEDPAPDTDDNTAQAPDAPSHLDIRG